MAQEMFRTEKSDKQETLAWVREGMPVYDRDDRKIGKVTDVKLGDGADDVPVNKPAAFYKLPPELQSRLAQHGFIQISRGFLARDVIATPEQIAELTDDHLRLNVGKESLVTL